MIKGLGINLANLLRETLYQPHDGITTDARQGEPCDPSSQRAKDKHRTTQHAARWIGVVESMVGAGGRRCLQTPPGASHPSRSTGRGADPQVGNWSPRGQRIIQRTTTSQSQTLTRIIWRTQRILIQVIYTSLEPPLPISFPTYLIKLTMFHQETDLLKDHHHILLVAPFTLQFSVGEMHPSITASHVCNQQHKPFLWHYPLASSRLNPCTESFETTLRLNQPQCTLNLFVLN